MAQSAAEIALEKCRRQWAEVMARAGSLPTVAEKQEVVEQFIAQRVENPHTADNERLRLRLMYALNLPGGERAVSFGP